MFKMTDDEYFGLPRLSNSLLSELTKSPAHLKHRMDNPMQPTAAMRLGTAVHCAVLEPDVYPDLYTCETINKRTKEGKARVAELEASGVTLLDPSERDKIEFMAMGVDCHPIAGHAINFAEEFEQVSLFDHLGVQCKSKLDIIGGDGYIYDLKTTSDASGRGIEQSINKYGYYRQAAFYMSAYKAATGEQAKGFKFIFVESSAPYGVRVVELCQEYLSYGFTEVDRLINVYKDCMERDRWPCYDNEELVIAKPSWL